ncbi:ParB/RepB/Spo0J family partition protein [Klebsiella pneumoniae]|nr:ParB/RepB/Spo0J family partition protein [Klebsiella pneumoniae]MCF0383421.1 ParB/RepB/Spo0J family partition protein [Klebsiella pneumoniae]
MAKNSIEVYGASGKTNVLTFEPEHLHLITDKTHPLYDERVHLPIDEGMVLNIKELGVLEPIIVWKNSETGLTCVVVGRQRVKHTLEANKLLLKEGKAPLLVPGVVKRGSANQMAKYMVSENEIRRPDTPLGRAKKMSDALDRGLDEDDIAVLFGCSVQTVRATLSLLEATQARQLGAITPEEQRAKVAEIERATAGTKGHEKARRQRQILGEAKPRIKSRKEITKALESAEGEYASALRWVLGEAL